MSDLIDREAVIKDLITNFAYHYPLFDGSRLGAKDYLVRREDVVASLLKRPTVEAEPVRHGRWVRTQVRRNGEIHTLYVCSECNDYHGFKDDPGEHTFKENYLYCRMCGAKMDGGTENA